MKNILLMIMIAAGNHLFGASVVWKPGIVNCWPSEGETGMEYNFYGYAMNGHVSVLSVDGPLRVYEKNGGLYMRQLDHGTTEMPVPNNRWVFAQYGDMLSQDSFSHLESIPLCDWYDWSATGGVLVDSPEDFYMGFETDRKNAEGQSYYGWMHVSIDSDLRMTLLDSDINLDGGSVFVGRESSASPEPNTAALLVIGAAFLALRRKRRVSLGIRWRVEFSPPPPFSSSRIQQQCADAYQHQHR